MIKLTPKDFDKDAAPASLVLDAYNAVHDLVMQRAGHGLVDDSQAFALAIAATMAGAHELAVDVAKRTAPPYHYNANRCEAQ